LVNTIIASVLLFGLLIFAHEFGHFLAARRAGIHVIEFAIGFGPRLIGWEKNNTRYSLRVFPLGGFCRMLGEDPDEVVEEDSFQSKSIISRIGVIFAGPFMNFLLAILLFFVVFFFISGVPLTDSTTIGRIIPEGPAHAVGLQEGDTITAINEIEVDEWSEVVARINAHPAQEISIAFERNGRHQQLTVVTMKDEQTGRGLIGIAPLQKKYAFFPSLSLGVGNTFGFVKLIFVSLWQMVTGQIPADVAGPVGIIMVVSEVVETGLGNFFTLAAIISINLGIINLLPIPAMDGSRLVFLVLEGIRGRPVDPQKEGFIHFLGFTVLILLMILIAYQDLTRFNF
jgi:regulator of sigma E protease